MQAKNAVSLPSRENPGTFLFVFAFFALLRLAWAMLFASCCDIQPAGTHEALILIFTHFASLISHDVT
jgi:hypothetical protein